MTIVGNKLVQERNQVLCLATVKRYHVNLGAQELNAGRDKMRKGKSKTLPEHIKTNNESEGKRMNVSEESRRLNIK